MKWNTRALVVSAVTAVAGLVGTSNSAQADLIAYDGFDYPATESLGGQVGGTGSWQSAWGSVAGGTVDVTSPGLGSNAPGTLVVTGNKVLNTPTSNSTQPGRFFSESLYATGSLYVSALMQKTNEGNRFFGLQFRNGTAEELFVGQGSGTATYRTSGSTGTIQTSTLLSTTTVSTTPPDFVVVRIDFNVLGTANNRERVRVYLNPTPGAAEPGTALIDSVANTNVDIEGVNAIGLGAGLGNGTTTSTVTGLFDELRIGSAWADVTPANATAPEPASLGLLGVAALGGLSRRCRRRAGR